LCEESQHHGVLESPDCVLVSWLTDCQCEEQNTIDMGELEMLPILAQAGCDPDPGDSGWTKMCDCIDFYPSFGSVCVTLTQSPSGAVTSDFEVTFSPNFCVCVHI